MNEMCDDTVKMIFTLKRTNVINSKGDVFTEEGLKSAVADWNKNLNTINVRDVNNKRIIGIVHNMVCLLGSGKLEALVEIDKDELERRKVNGHCTGRKFHNWVELGND